MLMAVFFLGSNPVAVKLAVLDIPPLPFVAIRFLLAGLLLLPVALLLGRGREVGLKDLLNMAGVGFVGVGMNNVAFTLGVSMTTASDTALIYAAVPIWGMLLGLALGLERPTLWGVVGVALAFLGVGVVMYGGLGGGGGSSLEGDLLVVIATICWGSYAVLSLPLLRTYSPLTVAAYTMLFGVSPPYPARRSGLLGGRVEPNKQRGVGGHGLFDAVGGGLWVLGLAMGGFPGRCQQGPRLPVPDHPRRRRLRCCAAG